MSTKVTNEPPKGLRAGMQRSYTAIIDQDRLERIDSPVWRSLLFTLCFTHSVVQERRKFGPLGWCVPYEFNDGDLNATIMFLEKHLEQSPLSWSTLQYMSGEVQYGGRITDNIDRRLFSAYTEAWLSPQTLSSAFTFNPESPIHKIHNNFSYKIPKVAKIDQLVWFLTQFTGSLFSFPCFIFYSCICIYLYLLVEKLFSVIFFLLRFSTTGRRDLRIFVIYTADT